MCLIVFIPKKSRHSILNYKDYIFKFLNLENIKEQNFVKGKITKYECISFAIIFIMIELIYVKITFVCESERSFFTKRVLFFLYKKVLRKAG